MRRSHGMRLPYPPNGLTRSTHASGSAPCRHYVGKYVDTVWTLYRHCVGRRINEHVHDRRNHAERMIGTQRAKGRVGMVTPENASHGQYFSAHPQTPDVRRALHVTLRGHEMDVESSHGVFSMNRVDLGTSVLLRHAPLPPAHGRFLDLGCGWGPIALTLSKESPDAQVVGVDVNERAVELTVSNAQRNDCKNVFAFTPDGLPEGLTFDLIWSNPPIRVGKAELHALLLRYLALLNADGDAYLVVQKNLGADSLKSWLEQTLNPRERADAPPEWDIEKTASSKGFRILHLHRNAAGDDGREAEVTSSQSQKHETEHLAI